MTPSELIRLRRQMHRRIREVVAERRLAAQPSGDAETTQDLGGVDQTPMPTS